MKLSHQIFVPLMMLMVVPRRPTSGKRARNAHAHCSVLKEEEDCGGGGGWRDLHHQLRLQQLRYSTLHVHHTKEAESKRGKGPEVGLGQGQVHAWPLRPPQPGLQVQSADARPRRPPPLRLESRQERVSAVRRVTKKKCIVFSLRYCV